MAKTKAKRLLSLLLSLAMVFSLAVTPVYATDVGGSSGTAASDTGETTTEPDIGGSSSSGDTSADSSSNSDGDTSADGSTDTGETTEEEASDSSADSSTEEETTRETSTVTVATIGSTPYETLADAFSAVKDGETITLTGDVTVTDATYNGSGLYQVSKKTVTLDLDDHTLTVDTTRVFGVLDGGSLTVKNGTVAVSKAGDYTQFNILRGACSFAAENVTFDGGNFSSNFIQTATDCVANIALTNCTIQNESGNVVYDPDGKSTVTLTGCNYSIRPIGCPTGSGVDNYTIVFNKNNVITAESTNYEATNALYYNYVVAEGGSITRSDTLSLNSKASLTVAGGTVSANVTVAAGTGMTVESGTVTGNITVRDGGSLAITGGAVKGKVNTSGSFTMSGGEAVNTDDTATEVIMVNGGSVDITGGTVTNSATGTAYARAIVFASSGTITGSISGGTFTGAGDAALLARANESNTVKITGGSYTASNGLYLLQDLLADGYGAYDTEDTAVTANNYSQYRSTLEDKTVVVHLADAAAKVSSGVYYATLQEAINAAGDNGTVTLLKNVTEDITVGAELMFTLDLNGCTITNNSDHTIINYAKTLTIVDSSEDKSGVVDNTTHGKGALVNYGYVILLGGTYKRSAEAGSSSSNNGGNSWYTIKNYAWMDIGDLYGEEECSVVVENSGSYSSCVANGYQNSSDMTAAQAITAEGGYTPYLTIVDGTFSGGLNTIKNDDCGELYIAGGKFSNSNQTVLQNHYAAYIVGGTFTATNGANVLYNCGCDSTYDLGWLYVVGGTFDAGDGDVLVEVSTAEQDIDNDYYPLVYIADGSFNGNINVATYSTAVVQVEGGYYSNSSVEAYLADGYQLAEKSESADPDELPYVVVDSSDGIFLGKNIDLEEGKIILNVYVEDIWDSEEEAYDAITVTMEGDTDTSRSSVEKFAGYVTMINNTDYYDCYVVSQEIDPRMMTHTLTVTVDLSGGYGYVVNYETSVRDYAEAILTAEDGTYDDKYYWAMASMLNYGAALQLYDGYETGNLANAGYDFWGSNPFAGYKFDTFARMDYGWIYYDEDDSNAAFTLPDAEYMSGNSRGKLQTMTDSGYNGIKLTSMSIYFDYDFTVKLTFSENLGDDDWLYLGWKSNTVDYSVDGNVITIRGLGATDLQYNLDIYTYDEANNKKITRLYPGYYYARLLAQNSNESYQTLGQALYVYVGCMWWAIVRFY